jgi:L-threonylcarbamoyladenylate synthase
MSGWHPWRVNAAARLVTSGGVIGYPTESVYGLGCDPQDPHAVSHLLSIKGRSAAKGLILIAADVAALQPWVEIPDNQWRADILASWPGPNTWVLPRQRMAPAWVGGGRPTLAVRVTDHPLANGLCRAVGGAVVSTSANRSGQAPLRTALGVRRQLGRFLDGVLGGAVGNSSRPTAIRDGMTGVWIRKP